VDAEGVIGRIDNLRAFAKPFTLEEKIIMAKGPARAEITGQNRLREKVFELISKE
jgi:hypothetical protein